MRRSRMVCSLFLWSVQCGWLWYPRSVNFQLLYCLRFNACVTVIRVKSVSYQWSRRLKLERARQSQLYLPCYAVYQLIHFFMTIVCNVLLVNLLQCKLNKPLSFFDYINTHRCSDRCTPKTQWTPIPTQFCPILTKYATDFLVLYINWNLILADT